MKRSRTCNDLTSLHSSPPREAARSPHPTSAPLRHRQLGAPTFEATHPTGGGYFFPQHLSDPGGFLPPQAPLSNVTHRFITHPALTPPQVSFHNNPLPITTTTRWGLAAPDHEVAISTRTLLSRGESVRKRKSEHDLGAMLQQEQQEEEEEEQQQELNPEADWCHYVELTDQLMAEQDEEEEEDDDFVLELSPASHAGEEDPVSTLSSGSLCSFEDQQGEDSPSHSRDDDQASKPLSLDLNNKESFIFSPDSPPSTLLNFQRLTLGGKADSADNNHLDCTVSCRGSHCRRTGASFWPAHLLFGEQ